jgi:hypothetical protein
MTTDHPPAWDDADIHVVTGETPEALVEFIPARAILLDGVARMEQAEDKAGRFAVLAELLARGEDLPGWARGCEAEYARIAALPGGRDLAAQLRRAAKEAARVAAEKAEAERKASEVIVPEFVPEAPKGVKMVADFEVLDLDLLYRADCSLVKLEAKRAEILAAIARQTIGETLPTIPGLRVFLKPQVR